jgi:hypothetical protein
MRNTIGVSVLAIIIAGGICYSARYKVGIKSSVYEEDRSGLVVLDYGEVFSKNLNTPTPTPLTEVEIQIDKGLIEAKSTGSFTTPFSIFGHIVNGSVPKHPHATGIRLQLYHDWTDVLVHDNSIVTLRFTKEGILFDIKDFIVTGIGQ